MKVTSTKLALLAALLALVCPGTGRADDDGAPDHPKHGLQAKIQYCSDCHGSSGQGYRGYLVMPRLAGQQTEYFENQLRAFSEHRRDTHFILNMAKTHGVNPTMRTGLAKHFRNLNPGRFASAPRGLAATGKKIYDEGVPEANVPACSVCHGPGAKGDGANPRLAGQLYSYSVKVLANWRKERGQDAAGADTASVMQPIATALSRQQSAAVSAYLSSLK